MSKIVPTVPGDPAGVADRMAGIAPFHVMSILAKAKALEASGRDIIHMEIGEPDFPTPQPIVEAGLHALQQGLTKYTPAAGLPALRDAISTYYRDRYDLEIAAERILVTPGASGALQLVLGALVNPGDQILMPDPAYPCNRHLVRLFDGEAVSLATHAADGFSLSSARVAEAWGSRTRALMLASPANPTGVCISQDALAAQYAAVRRLGGCLIVDEIYQGLEYDAPSHSALALGESDLFVVNSFSKYFGMTGWRVGWVVCPSSWATVLERLAQNLFLAAPTMSQYAALAAFLPASQAAMARNRDVLAQRRDYLRNALTTLGFRISHEPSGAFYLYADCRAFTDDSAALAADLLNQVGVAVTPGLDFGSVSAPHYLRFAYTTDEHRLVEGVTRLQRFLTDRVHSA